METVQPFTVQCSAQQLESHSGEEIMATVAKIKVKKLLRVSMPHLIDSLLGVDQGS